jgi:hypothetical protein
MVIEAILKINPSAVVSVSGTDIDNCVIEWLEGTTPISKADIKAKIDETAYIDNRAKEYPSWQDQMDMQYWDKINNTSTWQDAVQAVKDKYPKP